MSNGIREISETSFSVGSKTFKVRIFDSGDGPEVEFSRVLHGDSLSTMTVSLSKQALRVLGRQFLNASKREFSESNVNSAIFDENESKLNEELAQDLIDDGIVDSNIEKFLKMERGLGETLGDVSPEAQDFVEKINDTFFEFTEQLQDETPDEVEKLEENVVGKVSELFTNLNLEEDLGNVPDEKDSFNEDDIETNEDGNEDLNQKEVVSEKEIEDMDKETLVQIVKAMRDKEM